MPEYTGPDISMGHSRDNAPFKNAGGGLPPFFAGLLPEGHWWRCSRRCSDHTARRSDYITESINQRTPRDP
ncbi:hypothetical protein [Corynebacterium sp. H130]|uniref:hypothetical protein n=1 Tax=Corynebacterium sp. H130 TaxID=3133444 RepID=UPI00403F7F77